MGQPDYVSLVGSPQLLGAAIRDARAVRDWSQAQLAERLGVNRNTVVRLERGDNVGTAVALTALLELGLSLFAAPVGSRPTIDHTRDGNNG